MARGFVAVTKTSNSQQQVIERLEVCAVRPGPTDRNLLLADGSTLEVTASAASLLDALGMNGDLTPSNGDAYVYVAPHTIIGFSQHIGFGTTYIDFRGGHQVEVDESVATIVSLVDARVYFGTLTI